MSLLRDSKSLLRPPTGWNCRYVGDLAAEYVDLSVKYSFLGRTQSSAFYVLFRINCFS